MSQVYTETTDFISYENLAQVSTEASDEENLKENATSEAFEYFFGSLLTTFSLLILWKNEKKIVTFAKCINQGRDLVRSVDCEDTDEDNEFELVHLTGETVNN